MDIKNKEYNNIVISEDVVAKVASIAACDVAGVANVVPNRTDIKGIFKDETLRAVSVEKNGKTAVVDVYIKIEEGYKVREVADNVQKSVKEQVQNMTGVVITKVNVHISEIKKKKNEAKTGKDA